MNRRTRTVLTMAVLAGLAASACNRTASVSPPSGGQFLEAEAAFRAGDFVRANALYRVITDEAEGSGEREAALARRAFLYALPGTDLHDPAEARALLDRLVTEYPDTRLDAEVEALFAVLPVFEDLRQQGEEQRGEIRALEAAAGNDRLERTLFASFLDHVSPFGPVFDLEEARSEYRTLISGFPESVFRVASERMLFLVSQWQLHLVSGASYQQVVEELTELGIEVERLNEELQKLKEIDMGRRLPD